MIVLERLVEDEAELVDVRGPHVRALHASAWRMQTAAPVGSSVADIARIIPVESVTDAPDLSAVMLRDILTAVEWPLAGEAAPEVLDEDSESGAPSAALLLVAIRELKRSLMINQEQLCKYLGLSPSTVMLWKRQRDVHPRHVRIPALLRLWAATSGAREEFGDEGLQRLLGAQRSSDGLYAPTPEELSTWLLNAADAAGIAALEDDGYEPQTAVPLTVEEIEAGERELSEPLDQYLQGRGGADD